MTHMFLCYSCCMCLLLHASLPDAFFDVFFTGNLAPLQLYSVKHVCFNDLRFQSPDASGTFYTASISKLMIYLYTILLKTALYLAAKTTEGVNLSSFFLASPQAQKQNTKDIAGMDKVASVTKHR